MDVSVVIPIYQEEDSVGLLCEQLHAALSAGTRTYEIVLVDDGSLDLTWERMKAAVARYPHFVLLRLRRNFGQTAAMSAGFDRAQGDIVVTLDADLQNDPADIPMLLDRMRVDVDVVSGWRRDRKDAWINRRLPSMLANAMISRITGVALHDYGCTLKAYRKDVIKNVRLYGEMHRFIPALASWVGGRVEEVVVRHHPRRFGKTKYGISRTLRVALDLMTVKFLLRYSTGPMQIFGKIGALIGIPGILLLAFIFFAHLSYLAFGTEFAADYIKRPFWIMSSFMLVFLGMQFISVGLLAEVQTRTYHESQSKPVYVLREVHESPNRQPGPAA